MHNRSIIYLFIACFLVFWSCTSNVEPGSNIAAQPQNPAADGFDLEHSDEKAIAIADQVMEAMGGRKNWDQTRYLSWNFFGVRHLTWDKKTGNVRIQSNDSTIYQINVFEDSGKIMKEGELLTEPDSITKYVNRGKGIWINDSYWLVMPFKLKDSGVTLKYLREDTIAGGQKADVLELTFKEVGNTPDNKYLVYVDQSDQLIKQWDFYSKASDAEPRISTPWIDYEQKGKILLSGNRGRRNLSEIEVHDELPNSVFTTFSYN